MPFWRFSHLFPASVTAPVRAAVLAALVLSPVAGTAPARAADFGTDVPAVLSAEDVARYQKIFALQKKGDWHKADDQIKQLEDRVLMGHVLAQRYLHPTKYRSKYKELKDWMAEYADLHYASQIYKLALRRKPANWKSPKRPAPTNRASSQTGDEYQDPPGQKRLSKKQYRLMTANMRKLRGYLRRGATKSAKTLIQSEEIKHLFRQIDYDRAQARLAFGYFVDGRDQWAVDWAARAIKGSGRYVPEAHWTAGLASWRLGNFGQAAEHFAAAADGADRSSWTVSQAAFWAARAHLVARTPGKVAPYLKLAASYPETFYGILARRLLGRDLGFDWRAPPIDENAITHVLATKAGRRALALLQLDETYLAERELRGLAGRSDITMARDLLGFATRAKMAGLALRLNDMLKAAGDGAGYATAAYPLPNWEPDGGFTVDRALIYSIIRQESKFNPRAKSGAGARGLMQLMPRTAGFVARDRRFYRTRDVRSTLFQPKVSLTLGQKYVRTLLEDTAINGDMFFMATAWNGGPGNLNKWRRRTDYLDDALFFIESIPSRETRNFVERVFANLWIYRDRLGEGRPTLDAIASGNWPRYVAQDDTDAPVTLAANQ